MAPLPFVEQTLPVYYKGDKSGLVPNGQSFFCLLNEPKSQQTEDPKSVHTLQPSSIFVFV